MKWTPPLIQQSQWGRGWKDDWKPKDPLRNLVRAGALIAAEIDRIQRTAAAQGQMPDTKGDSPRTGDSTPGVVTSGNERPSGGLSPNFPAPAAAQTETKSTLSKTIINPADGWPFPVIGE